MKHFEKTKYYKLKVTEFKNKSQNRIKNNYNDKSQTIITLEQGQGVVRLYTWTDPKHLPVELGIHSYTGTFPNDSCKVGCIEFFWMPKNDWTLA